MNQLHENPTFLLKDIVQYLKDPEKNNLPNGSLFNVIQLVQCSDIINHIEVIEDTRHARGSIIGENSESMRSSSRFYPKSIVFIFSTSKNQIKKLTLKKVDKEQQEEKSKGVGISYIELLQDAGVGPELFEAKIEEVVDLYSRFYREKIIFKIKRGYIYYTKIGVNNEQMRSQQNMHRDLEKRQNSHLETLKTSTISKVKAELCLVMNSINRMKQETNRRTSNLKQLDTRGRKSGVSSRKSRFIGCVNLLNLKDKSELHFDSYSGFIGTLDLGGLVDFEVCSKRKVVYALSKNGEIHYFSNKSKSYIGVYDLGRKEKEEIIDEELEAFEENMGFRKKKKKKRKRKSKKLEDSRSDEGSSNEESSESDDQTGKAILKKCDFLIFCF